jgi:hypothetical protein
MRNCRSEMEGSRGLGQRAEEARVEIEQSWHISWWWWGWCWVMGGRLLVYGVAVLLLLFL